MVFIPILLYLLASMPGVYKINPRLGFLSALLIVTRIAWDFWTTSISSITFIFTLFLVCAHIHVMSQPIYMNEEAPGK